MPYFMSYYKQQISNLAPLFFMALLKMFIYKITVPLAKR